MISRMPTIFMAMAMVDGQQHDEDGCAPLAVDALGGGQLLVHGEAQQRLPQPGDDGEHRRAAAEDPGRVGAGDGEDVAEQEAHQVDRRAA